MTYKKVGTVRKKKGVQPGDIMTRHVGGGKYIAFRLTYGNKPKVVGLTVPLTKKQMKKHFDIKI